MLRKSLIITVLLVLASTSLLAQTTLNTFDYFHPRNNSKLVSKFNNIIVRQGSLLDKNSDLKNIATIKGSVSGVHEYTAVISDDDKTLVLKPIVEFTPGEVVKVTLNSGLKTQTGNIIGELGWQFTISPKIDYVRTPRPWLDSLMLANSENNDDANEDSDVPNNTADIVQSNGISIPSDLPPITVTTSGDTDSGYVFLSNFYGSDKQYIMMFDNNGEAVFYRRVAENTFDFKKQPAGVLTYYTYYTYQFYALDSTYTVVDSFQCGNGYELDTDPHDCQVLENGHFFVIAYDGQTIDMSQYVDCGRTNATVLGLILQEQDSDKNVIWQWRSWDHFEITDATWDISLCSSRIDYVHCNTVELDDDGNILISSRNLDEVTKINYTTGDIIWRLGGENNMFTFDNDDRLFSHQHDIRRLPNGNVTLYDNGNLNSPFYSRAIEYALVDTNLTATNVWEYRQTPDVAAGVMGNQQRLESGHTVIGWGSVHPNMTELNEEGEVVFELTFDNSSVISYRAFRFPWHGVAAVPYLIDEEGEYGRRLIFNKFGDKSLDHYNIYADTLPEPTTLYDTTSNPWYEFVPNTSDSYYIRVAAVDTLGNISGYSDEVSFYLESTCMYLPGDVTMAVTGWPPEVLGGDVTFLVNYFRGIGSSIPCKLNDFYASADANGDCLVVGADVTYLVNYFRGFNSLGYCPNYETEWPTADDVPTSCPTGWPYCED